MDRVTKVGPGERTEGGYTAGIVREQAVATTGLWAGLARTEAGVTSGWHHHGAYETVVYVAAGRFKVESGPGGAEVVEASPGDFVFIPPQTVHRESNPTAEESRLIVFRSGTGQPDFNVDGPV